MQPRRKPCVLKHAGGCREQSYHSRPSSKPTRKPPPRKSNRVLAESIKLPPCEGKTATESSKGIHFMGTLFLLLCLSGVSLFPVLLHLPPGCFRLSFFSAIFFFQKTPFLVLCASSGGRAFMSANPIPSLWVLRAFCVPSLQTIQIAETQPNV